jgi:uncharacterized protein
MQMPWDFALIFAVLLIVIPWRGRARLRQLLLREGLGSREKITLYATTILFQWILASVVAWRALARGLTPAELGLARMGAAKTLLPTVLGAAVLGGLHWLNIRRAGKEGAAPELLRALATRILPHSSLEMLPYFALALTAGVCEEFLYRGFGMAALLHVGLPAWLVVLLTSLLFGLAHIYQGRGGALGTSFLGIVFGGFRLSLGSIVPLAVWHATIDVVAAIAGKKYFLRSPEQQQMA